MNFSKTLNYMLKSGEGYRNIGLSSGIKNLSKIISFEYTGLDNSDVFDFMKTNYKDYDIDSIETAEELIDYTLNFIANLFNTDSKDLSGVWLTTYQDALDLYCSEHFPENTNIIKVYIHENKMIPISDLDRDGVLFAFIGDLDIDKEWNSNE